jgi:hypothetical protein
VEAYRAGIIPKVVIVVFFANVMKSMTLGSNEHSEV